MASCTLDDPERLEQEVARLPHQSQLLWPYEKPVLRRLGAASAGCVIDLGCGDGSWLAALADVAADATLVGVERHPELARRASALARIGEVHALDCLSDALLDLLATRAPDLVIARFLLQHLSAADRSELLARVKRAGGRLIVIEIDDATLTFTPHSEALATLIARADAYQAARGGDRRFGPRLPTELRDAGFADVGLERFRIDSGGMGIDAWWPCWGPILQAPLRGRDDPALREAAEA